MGGLKGFFRGIILPRAIQAIMVAWIVGTLTFILTRALPGDMAYRIAAGRYGYDNVDQAAASAVRAELGLDQHPIVAYFSWLQDLLTLNLGVDMVSGDTVWAEVYHQVGHSLVLAFVAIAFSLLLGPTVGVAAGLWSGKTIDKASLMASTALRAIPSFITGILLILLLAVYFRLLPGGGHGAWQHAILPGLALALGLAAVSSRVTRNTVVGVLKTPYFAFARTKGLSQSTAFLRHGVRNASVPVVAYHGVQLIYLIEGVVVVESLFAWPGIGHALVHAIVARNVPMIQGTALTMGLMFVALNALVDAMCWGLDPRQRANTGGAENGPLVAASDEAKEEGAAA